LQESVVHLSLCTTNEQNVSSELGSFCLDLSRADGLVDALDNDETKIDFKPLYQCIHIYDALECKPELQRSYQQDRKVRGIPLILLTIDTSNSHPYIATVDHTRDPFIDATSSHARDGRLLHHRISCPSNDARLSLTA
jgi:hypothetical protein